MVASSCGAKPASGAFRTEAVGSASFLNRHNRQIFAEGRSFSGNERDKVFLNDGAARFVDVSALSGADSANDGRAVLAFDADGDGDLDLFVHETQRERHALYRNDVADGARGIALQLTAARGNVEGIGARVVLEAGGHTVAQVLTRGAGFLSCQAPELVFGLGDAEEATATVHWPGGGEDVFAGLRAGGRYRLVQGADGAARFDAPERTLPEPLGRGLRVRTGDRLTSVQVRGADGALEELRLDDVGPGETLMLNLWASYCGPCVAELPLLERWHAAGDARVVAVSVDAPADEDAARALLGERAPGLALRFAAEVEDGTGIGDLVDLARLPLPTTLVIGGGGVLERVVQGALDEVRDAPR